MENIFFMNEALKEAEKAFKKDEVPVGAVAVLDSKIIAKAHNKVISMNDPTAHAEILLLRGVSKKMGNFRLENISVYVTLEPCMMCMGAMVQARIGKLVYGTEDPKAGAVKSIIEFPFNRMNHRFDVISGVEKEKCSELLKSFFRNKRKKGEVPKRS